jgi:predicted amidohydrolase
MMICFDWFFPECARSLALRGADIIAHPANLVLPWCQRAMFARSVENHVFTVTANRIGTETRAGRSLTFTGGSQILSPNGEQLVAAPVTGEHAGVTQVDLTMARDKTTAGRNDLFGDRKPELYPGLD